MTTTSAAPNQLTTAGPAVSVLLRRGIVVVPVAPAADLSERQAGRLSRGLVALEADLIERGRLLSAETRRALAALSLDELADLGRFMLATFDEELGAAVPHVPLFRKFPSSTPTDTEQLWVDRVFSLLLQSPDQPCVLCGTVGSVSPVAPCAHLVCATCFDGSDYSACPICRRRISAGNSFLTPAPRRGKRVETATERAAPLLLLNVAVDLDSAALTVLTRLLGRDTAPNPADLADITTLTAHLGSFRPDLGWVPATIASRTAKAAVLATLLADVDTRDAAGALLPAHLSTATDVLRVATVLTGGPAGLTPGRLERMSTLARPLRRALLESLDALPLESVVEDMARHRVQWKRIAEKLRPFEHATRYPDAALAVAVTRGINLDTDAPGPLGDLLRSQADRHPQLRLVGGQLRHTSWATELEEALRVGDLAGALALASQRPGELLRRLDHLLRRTATEAPELLDELLDRVRDAAPRVSPAVLMSAAGSISTRTAPLAKRVFFPAGKIASAYAVADTRPVLPADAVASLAALLTTETLRRAGTLTRHDVALLDSGLVELVAPFTSRSTSKALVDVPRGSTQTLPTGKVLRLFLHWTEPAGTRVDLDLSAALYDEQWKFVGLCDYTQMRFGGTAAVHSGDLTSAPAPLGATEFVDLDLDLLAGAGVRHVVPVVFSYNDVPFDQMTDAFAGVMVRSADDARDGAHFDVRTVEQRFDLAGQARIAVPLLIDLAEAQLRWVDLNLNAAGYGHSVARYSRQLSVLASDLEAYFRTGSRVTLWQLACWHAAARTGRVVVRSGADLAVYERAVEESVEQFADRIVNRTAARDSGTDVAAALGKGTVFAALVRGDVPVAAGSEAYALYPGAVAASDVELVDATDLLTMLRPAQAARP